MEKLKGVNFDEDMKKNLRELAKWDFSVHDGIKYYSENFYGEKEKLVRVGYIGTRYEDRSLEVFFYQREKDFEKPYVLGKDEYYIEVILALALDEKEVKNELRFDIQDFIFKRIKKVDDIYNIANLTEEVSYELGNDLFKTLNMENDTFGDSESNLMKRIESTLKARKNSNVGNDILSKFIVFSSYDSPHFIYDENDKK